MIENLDVFVDGIFSNSAVTSNGNLNGIFDEEYLPIFDASTESRQITFTIKTSDTTNIHHGFELAIGARNFAVIGMQLVGDGKLTDLLLKEI